MNQGTSTSSARPDDSSPGGGEPARLRQAIRTSRRVHLISSVAFLWLGISMLLYWEGVQTPSAVAFTLFGAFEAVGATQLTRRPVPWALFLALVSTAVALSIAWVHINEYGLLTLPPRHVFDLLVVAGVLTVHWDAVPRGELRSLLRQRPESWRGDTPGG